MAVALLAVLFQLPQKRLVANLQLKQSLDFQTPLTNFRSNALSGDIHQYFTGSFNAFDYALDFGYQRIGSPYDASGDRVAQNQVRAIYMILTAAYIGDSLVII